MSQLLEISANVLSITEKMFPLTSSVGKRIVDSKWPLGISGELGKSLVDELMLFNVWIINREMEVSSIEKQVYLLSRSAFIKYCVSEDSKHLFRPRVKLYTQYTSDKIVTSLGQGDPLTACVLYLIEFLSENNEHYSLDSLDGRNLIPIINRQDQNCLFIASLFHVISCFIREVLLNNLLVENPVHVIDKLDDLLEQAIQKQK